MKKIILLVAVMLTSLLQAQDLITVTTTGGAPIAEGQVFVFNVPFNANTHAADLPIRVKNISSQTLRLKLRMESMENANGNLNFIQFCFNGICYYRVQPGSIVPASLDEAAELNPNDENNVQDHFGSSYTGDVAGQPVVYNLSIVQVDGSGTIVGNPLRRFTYRYEPTAGVNDFASLKSLGITVKSTVINNVVEIDATQNATLQVYGISGQLVKTAAIATGTQAIDASALATGVYIARFTTEDNKTSSIKIAKN
jgi:hypothetical protein